MKKLIPGLLSMLLCLGMATGCEVVQDKLPNISLPNISLPDISLPGVLGDLIGGKDSDTESVDSESESSTPTAPLHQHEKDLKDVKDYVQGIVNEMSLETRKNFTLINTFSFIGEEAKYDIAWSVNVEGVTVLEGEGVDTIVIGELAEDTPYVLTATITDPEGCHNVVANFDAVALKALSLVPTMITEKPAENTAYKLYVYQSTLAKDLYFTGYDKAATYYFGTTENYEEGVDVYAEYIDENNFNLSFTYEGVKKYIGVKLSDDGAHDNIVATTEPVSSFFWSEELQTVLTHLDVNKNGEAADYYLGNYSNKDTISASMTSYAGGSGNNVGGLVVMVDKSQFTPAVKVATELERLTVKTTFIGANNETLPSTGVVYSDVAINWTVKSGENVTITNNVLTTTAPAADTTAVITATITCGDVIETKDFTIAIKAETEGPGAILNQLYALGDGESVEGEFTLTGKITKLDSYSNPTIVVDGYDSMPVYCYRLSVTNAVGEYITVTATTMKNYGGTYEFMNCTLVENVTPEAPDPAAGAILNQLYALQDGEQVDGEFTLKGKITALDNYNNPTIVVDGYESMPVYCYKLKVTNAVGEYITVTATSMKNYMGTYEFMNCTLVVEGGDVGGGDEGEDPVDPPVGDDVVKATGDSFTIESYATANGWENSVCYETIEHEFYTVSVSATPVGEYSQNSGKYYTSGQNWRMYQTESATFTITAVEGKTIATVKISYAIKNTGILTFNGANYDSDAVITVNAASATFGVGQTADKTNGQVQITAIEVLFATEGGETPDPHEHNYTTAVTAPTCTEAGYTTYTCTCGDSYTADEVAATGHTFIDSKCTCGADYVAPTLGGWSLVTDINNGDHVLIGAPAYGKLLSAEKVNASSYYNKGVTYSTENFDAVTDAEIFVVTVNADGTYTFTSLTGKVIALAESYSSLNDTGIHKSWSLVDKGNGLFLMKNTGRNTYLEWYSSKDNWSTYTAGNTNEYELSFYAQKESAENHIHNHITETHAPTCTEDGYTSYTCACGDVYTVAGETATGHSYTETVKAPTCTEDGYTTHTCTCGDTYTDNVVTATGHTYVDGKCACGAEDPDVHVHSYTTVVTAPTCTVAGYTTYTCACGDTYTADETPVVEHIDTNLDITCDFEGCTKRILPPADSKVSLFTANHMIIVSLSSSYYVEGVVTAVNDAKNGIFTITDAEGYTLLVRLPKNAEGLAYSSWTENKVVVGDTIQVYGKPAKNSSAPTDVKAKIEGGVLTILKHEHNFTEPTCTDAAECACGAIGDAALGHINENGDNLCDRCEWNLNLKISNIVVATDPTLANGVLAADETSWTWENDNFTAVIAKGASTFTLYKTAKAYMQLKKQNTLTVAGKNGESIKTITIFVTNATQVGYLEAGLANNNVTFTKDEATLSITVDWNSAETFVIMNNGSSTVYVSGVEIVYEPKAAAHEHSYTTVVTAPTCTEAGYTTYTCTCGDSYTADEVTANGHSFVEGTCGVCGEADPDYVAPEVHEHSYTETVTAPTCTAAGYTTYTCACGESYTGNEVEPIAHADNDGNYKCDACSTKMLPADGEALTLAQAIAVAKVAGSSYTTNKYYITVEIVSVYNTTYGNMNVTDADGNDFTIYGTYSYDGKTRYDALSYKPVAGDEITVYGVLGTYNSTPQMKNGWIDEVIAHDHNYTSVVTDPTCTMAGYTTHTCSICKNSYTDSEVAALGHTTEAGTCERCGQEIGGEVTGPQQVAIFDFGSNGSAAHVDGSDLSASKTYTSNGYTLAFSTVTKVYSGAYDAKGNSCLKFGTSKLTGTLGIKVPEGVTKVVIYVAGYKAATSTNIKINNVAYTVKTASNNGDYTAIEVDTSSTSTVTFTTVTYRCMVNTIEFWA